MSINRKQFKKALSSANNEQKILLDGMQKVIDRPQLANIKVQESETTFTFEKGIVIGRNGEGNPIYGGSVTDVMTNILEGGTKSSEAKNMGYTPISINHNGSESSTYTTDEGNGSAKGNASSIFLHELLDEFLNVNVDGIVNNNSPKIDKVYYQNEALENIGLPKRNGKDHE